ncbi:caspase family protein [Persicitalea jodogahamensis]|uniref:Peptidase C14 caspase domain-containing protein n=1 Tax=Persicitalea jodogahamensis TaxID=402147 RepID=A0A8J3DE95_9BACT|nr:caspase family protein [Persicitalea jodogahamensis]GHB88920.1 hypothetical protein GCM10007390_51300 [Persicitalea jodogahamensis]
MKYAVLLLILLSSHLGFGQSGESLRWTEPFGRATIFTARADTTLRLEISLSNPEAAEQATIQLIRNGQKYAGSGQKRMGEEKLPKAEGQTVVLTKRVPLAEGDNTWQAEVTTPEGVKMRSPLLRIVRRVRKPNLYLLCVGVPYNLRYTRRDAQAIFNRFKTQEGHLFGKVEGKLLVCAQDTRYSPLGQTLSDLQREEMTEEDVLILFFSSHGTPSSLEGKDFGLVSNDASFGVRDERYVLLLYQKDIISNIENLPCKRIVLLDACHSGAAGGEKKWIGTLLEAQNIVAQTPSGLVTITSSSGSESSWEHPTWQQGAFTFALLEGLAGRADVAERGRKKDGIITVGELSQHVQNRVPHLVDSVFQESQHPRVYNPSALDYPIFNYKMKEKEVPLTTPVCAESEEKPSSGRKMAVLGLLPGSSSEMDRQLTEKVTESLRRSFSDYGVEEGKEKLIRDGTVIAIIDGYPPKSRGLANEFGVDCFCFVTRATSAYSQDATTRKWRAEVKFRLYFVSAHSQEILADRELTETGVGIDRAAAESAGIAAICQKIRNAKIVLKPMIPTTRN